MKITNYDMQGLKLIEVNRVADHRGYFAEVFNQDLNTRLGLSDNFIQDNESLSKQKYTFRGMHAQAPAFAQDKLVRVLQGKILDFVVDYRLGSSTYAKGMTFELSAENGLMLLVPKGFLHGFLTLSENCLVNYKINSPYNRASEITVNVFSKDFGFNFPMSKEKIILLPRDADAIDFCNSKSPFVFEK